ncbi:DNA (cytosine-5-)-methyltransferase [Haematospirillum jordaniae]|uniref:Cytosine-specific methyltransferase n=1 Tax=Haematospirillum jordaniae TaxID=1549855 RepID=A0A143DCT1_9PROT|nr:DNA (cytosine-5-)-methyltransferase [Haematospirillum jordaniae]AMW34561.1 DNA cytosine methyltransferase [Haematospirillum jordaniae]
MSSFQACRGHLRLTRGAPAFRFIDLFAGIGGMRRGFEAVGGACVFTSEWNRYSRETYQANFGCDDHPFEGDITAVSEAQIPEHDVLLAGFPCQPFSIAGVSKKNALKRPHGFDCQTQGTLFFEIERILATHRPRFFVLENVKNLVSHDKGRTFDVIRTSLTRQLGYHIAWRILDARPFVPQHRERIFIIGFRDGGDEFNFQAMPVPDRDRWPIMADILHPEDGTEAPDPPYTGPGGVVDPRYVLSSRLWVYLQDYAARHRARGNGFGYGLVGPGSAARTLSARYYKDGSEILVARPSGPPRRLTPRECARLMGFDSPGRSDFIIPVSDTQAYRQLGNAVVVPVVQALARYLSPWIVGVCAPSYTEEAGVG